MLDHANICWTIESLRLAVPFATEGFRLVSYLPMAHIAERVVTHYSGITFGYEVTTCPDLHVPRGVPPATPAARCSSAYPAPARRSTAGCEPCSRPIPRRPRSSSERWRSGSRSPPPAHGAKLSRPISPARSSRSTPRRCARCASCSVSTTLRVAVTAAAPIPVEILEFFRALGVPLSELYGLSESSGPITWEPERVRRAPSVARSPVSSCASRTTARCSAGAATSSAATSTIRRKPPRRSTPTAGSTPATSARSTTTATCASSTARRSSSSPRAARTSRPRTSRPRSRPSR